MIKKLKNIKNRLTKCKSKILIILATTIIIGITSYIFIPKISNLFHKKTTSEYIFSRPDNRPDEIKGEIITLKRLQPKYYIDYFKMINDPRVFNSLYPFPLKSNFTYRRIKEDLDRDLRKEAADKIFKYIIFDNKDNILIGSLEIREPNSKDNGQFGCWLNPKYWGGGRIQEAIKLITNEYFKIKQVEKFSAHINMHNLRSYYGLKKAGFKLIKTLHFDNMPSRYYLEFYNPYKIKKSEK